MINRYFLISLVLIIVIISFSMADCSRDRSAKIKMDLAESIMESRPDSALSVLDEIDKTDLNGEKERARYALLKSVALDKNCMDTTTFDVIQPAIDYYLNCGTPDEKFRTLYYQGRIYQNGGDDDSAMKCFLLANDQRSEMKDSLLLARNLVAMGTLYIKQYKIKEFIDVNNDAAKIYNRADNHIFEIKSNVNIITGYILQKNKEKADSVLAALVPLVKKYPDGSNFLLSALMIYKIHFCKENEIRSFLDQFQSSELNQDDALGMAMGYSKIGEYDKAISIISDLTIMGSILDSLKYTSIKTSLYEGKGDTEQALLAFKEYYGLLTRHHQNLFSKELLFADKKHQLEIDNLKKIQERDRIIWGVTACVFILLMLIGWQYYRYRLSRSKQLLIEKENENLRLASENLNREKKNIELERDKKILEANNLEKEKALLLAEQRQQELEADNLLLEKKQLEDERDNLKELLKEQTEMSGSVLKIIRSRLDILNGLLAKEITNNEDYAKPYNKWIESVRTDKEEFMTSTRLAFTASHPRFIAYLVQNGLTEDEINYVCMYAIGLRGKEVGDYIKLKRHYNVSSDIRKKLGLDEHETNLGLYIRRKIKELSSDNP